MQTVRRRITEILKENGTATVAQLAGMLGMAQVSVRHHLDILVGEDLVELSGVRRHNGAGRPSQVYVLTPNAAALFPQRHAALANDMLVEMKASLPGAEFRGILQRVAKKTAQEAPLVRPDEPIEVRLGKIADFMTEKGYNARWERQDDHYELQACNCPFAGVSDQHPELCAMDQAMMRELLPSAERQQLGMANGASRCTYVLSLIPATADEA